MANQLFSTDLLELFNRSFSLQPELRPTAKEWLQELLSIVGNQTLIIHGCGAAQFINNKHECCRHCGDKLIFEHGMRLVLREQSGGLIAIDADCFVGRSDFHAAPETISGKHLKFRCNGIDWFVTPVGLNQTGAWTAKARDWVALENNREYRLAKHYFPLRLWVGGYEAVLEPLNS